MRVQFVLKQLFLVSSHVFRYIVIAYLFLRFLLVRIFEIMFISGKCKYEQRHMFLLKKKPKVKNRKNLRIN